MRGGDRKARLSPALPGSGQGEGGCCLPGRSRLLAGSSRWGERGVTPTQPPPQAGEVRFGRLRSRGFSLIELLVVLVLIGIMAGVAAPAVGRFVDTLEFREQVAEVMAIVRYARLKAITEGKLLVITADTDASSHSLTLSGAVYEVRDLELAEDATLEIEPLELVFSPEGYATPGSLKLTSGERSETITIDPLTALPMLEAADNE